MIDPNPQDLIALKENGGDDADLLLLEKINELEDQVGAIHEAILLDPPLDQKLEKVAMKVAANLVDVAKGDPGDPGDNYVLTEADKAEIAAQITVPVVEKEVQTIVEKTEVIREQPIVTEITKVEQVAVADTAEQIRDKLEMLVGDEQFDKKFIRGLTVSNLPPMNPKIGDLWIVI